MDINFELKSEKGFDDTLASLMENLVAEGFGVLWSFDLGEKLMMHGSTKEYKCMVLEICNPAKAVEAVELNPDAAYFLPCKVVVFERAEVVFVGMIRPSLMMELLGDQELMAVAHDVERHLKRAIMESV